MLDNCRKYNLCACADIHIYVLAISSVLLMFGREVRLLLEQFTAVPLSPCTAVNCSDEFSDTPPLSVRTAVNVPLSVCVNPTLSRGLMNAMYRAEKAELVQSIMFPVTEHW